MIKTRTLWQIREFPISDAPTYSVALGRRLRSFANASRIEKALRAKGRDVFAVPFKVNT
jgi:hypothetical protein